MVNKELMIVADCLGLTVWCDKLIKDGSVIYGIKNGSIVCQWYLKYYTLVHSLTTNTTKIYKLRMEL